MKLKSIFFSVFAIAAAQTVCAQTSILVLNSSTDVVYKLNATDGTIIDPAFITLPSGTPKGITQVDDKIWIADQVNDDIYIYNLDGTPHSTLDGTVVNLDNIRGLNVVNNEVWVTNAGSGNGATANSIRRFTKAGVPIGSYPTVSSPFDVIDNGTAAFVSSFTASGGIEILGYDGVVQGNLFATPTLSNVEQMTFNAANNLVVVTFSNHSSGNNRGIYELSPTTGAILNYWPSTGTSGNSGVIQLGNGNYLYSNNAMHLLDPVTGTSTLIESGTFQYFTKITDNSMSTAETIKVDFEMYPNPVTETLFVKATEKITEFRIFSPEGRLVLTQQPKSERFSVDVADLASGVYYLQMSSDKGMSTKKFLKK